MSQTNLAGWVSLPVHLSLPRMAEATESRVTGQGAQMSGCPRVGRKTFQRRRKVFLTPLADPPTPTPQGFSLVHLRGHFSALYPFPPPTSLFPFLDFIFHGEVSPAIRPPSWPPPPPSPPTQFLCSFSCLVGNSTSLGVPAPPV